MWKQDYAFKALSPQSLWIFKGGRKHCMQAYLEVIQQEIRFLKARITPEMRGRLQKDSQRHEYECQMCGEVFAKGCALGGHISKRHSGRHRSAIKEKEREAVEQDREGVEQEAVSASILPLSSGESLLQGITYCQRTPPILLDLLSQAGKDK